MEKIMDTNNEDVPSTARLDFGQRAAAQPAPVENTQADAQAEEAQQEAMTAEAEAQPEATVEAEAETETSEAVPVDAPEAPVETVETDADTATVEADEVATDPVPVADEPAQDAAVETPEVSDEVQDEAEAVNETRDELAAPDVEVDAAETLTPEALADAAAEAKALDEPVEVEIDDPAASEPGKSVEELQAERQKLDDEIKVKQDAQKASVIAQIKTVVETYEIPVEELVEALGGLKSKRKGVPAKPKYKDPATGVIWSGRGKAPAWIKDKNFDDFLIEKVEAKQAKDAKKAPKGT